MILGQYKATSGNDVDLYLNDLTPTFFAAALFIDNSRWDGVPFMVRTGMGMIKHRSDSFIIALKRLTFLSKL